MILALTLWRCNWTILNIIVLMLHTRKRFAQDMGFKQLLFEGLEKQAEQCIHFPCVSASHCLNKAQLN